MDLIGKTLSHYLISDRLGAGGMGVVYRAVDTRLNRTVAIKLLAADAVADPDRKRRFVTEARAASALNHPNIVTIHEIDQADGLDFLVMELVAGQPLGRLIPERGLPVDRALNYALQIASALAAAHAAGIVHRDIKPANIIAADTGTIKLLDFGVSKLLNCANADASTIEGTRFGVVVGTLRYMAPEQVQAQPTDPRADIFSFGAVLYEMLAGCPAFPGDNPVTAILGRAPAPLGAYRHDLSPDLVALIDGCLSKDAAARPSAQQLVDRLSAIRDTRTHAPVGLGQIVRRRVVSIPVVLFLIAAAAVGAWRWRANARVRWARTIAPAAIQRLIDRDDYDGAYRIAREALTVAPDDGELKQEWFNVTFLTTIDSTPPGADVAVKGYTANDAGWIPLGRTPLQEVRVPFGQVRVRVSKEGFAPIEATLGGLRFNYVLDPPASIPPGMVRVQGSTARVDAASAEVSDFWMDKFEVTNREFKAFVDGGGYRRREFWKEPFVENGRTLPWEDAMAILRDTTGRPGPSTWELGTYPDGTSDLPVTGVSWYEAAAYARFAGKSMPTAFHWRVAAGYADFSGNFADILNVSNFSGKGLARVGSFQGLGPSGTFDMAGNAKEWCWNASADRRFILGGSWNEPSYAFTDMDAQPPFDRQSTFGFRLVKYIQPPAADTTAPISRSALDPIDTPPVGDAIFEVYRNLYRYDATPLNATVVTTEDAPAWRKDTITYDAAYGNERIRAYLFLPKASSPPYQTVLFFPGGDAMFLRSSRELRMQSIEFIIRAGRAVLVPVYKGMYERGPVRVTGPAAFRDLMIERSKDIGRSLDYLATRNDVDHARVAYYGISLGAWAGVVFTAIEPRFKASVLLSGGLESVRPPPEADLWNFAPRVRMPTLMVNGKADFGYPVETSQLPLYRALGAEVKHHALFDGGHIPVRIHDMMREILDWFDRYMGPVKP